MSRNTKPSTRSGKDFSNGHGRKHGEVFKTKPVDFKKMKSVRIDASTHILVPAGEDPEKAIKKYHQHVQANPFREKIIKMKA